MKKNKIIYWVTTGIISIMMLFSAYQYLTNPQMKEAFIHLGFPDYFRIELAFAKVIGAAVLLIPQVPVRIKEWAYAAFGIVFISALIAHFYTGDAAAMIVAPVILTGILVISNLYMYKLQTITRPYKPAAALSKV